MGTKRIHAQLAHDLGMAIVSGRYAPGDTLPGEVEFSEQLKVSRTAYREAIRTLSAKGLVESRTNTGTRVTPRARWNFLDPEVLAWAIESPTEQFIRDLFELRMIVEPGAAALAATRRTSRQLSRMGHALEEMEKHGLGDPKGRAADHEFHSILLEATGNEPLMTLSSTIAAVVNWTTVFKYRHCEVQRDPIPDHRALFEGIAEASPKNARSAMVELIRLALEDTRMSLDPPPESRAIPEHQ